MSCKSIVLVALLIISIAFVQGIPSERIINGVDAPATPFHAHLIIRETPISPSAFVGSGAILTTRHVITVGQNVNNFEHWEVGVGNTIRLYLQFYSATTGILHPSYDAVNLNFNIAILVTDIDIVFIDNLVQPIQFLDNPIWPLPNQVISATGFGFTTSTGNFAETLQIADFRVMEELNCQQSFPQLTLNGHFCGIDMDTVEPNLPVNICAGDQGGPCFFPLTYQLVGLTSYTTTDCGAGQAAVFVRVSTHAAWIQQILNAPL